MRKTIFFFFFLFIFLQGYTQGKSGNSFKIAFYNVENLFDTIDDPNKSDNDFLPGSKVAWTAIRYHQKLTHIASVLRAIDSVSLPAVIGLAEIENIGVLQDLISCEPLRSGKYKAILEEGDDPRGIDVAMIYRRDIVRYVGHRAFPSANSFKSRAILYVKFVNLKKDTLHIFVNHWKSREGGAAETEPKRIENATILRHLSDSLFKINPGANIVILGDFNDEPGDKSISETLGAVKPVAKPVAKSLYNLMYILKENGGGTLYYKSWDLFDQIIVSGNLLIRKPEKGAVILPPYAYIFKPDWILYKNKTGELVPNRTASSSSFFGGYSDHLPVYTIVKNGPAIIDN
ncbi:MAG: hypothetical protein WCI71_02595 [Bacteroidota bacterium]